MGNFINKGNVSGNVNMADRDIIFNSESNNLKSVEELIEKIITLVESNSGEIELEHKESLIDDLHTIEEQSKSNSPSLFKIKKALGGITTVLTFIPKGIEWGQKLLDSSQELINTIINMFHL